MTGVALRNSFLDIIAPIGRETLPTCDCPVGPCSVQVRITCLMSNRALGLNRQIASEACKRELNRHGSGINGDPEHGSDLGGSR